MSTLSLLALAAAALALGLVLLGLELLSRSNREERSARVLQTALNIGQAQPGMARTESKVSGSLAQRWLLWLESVGHSLSGSRLETAMLAPEDRLLLDQAGWNSSTGRATYLGLRLLLACALPVIVMIWRHPGGIQALAYIIVALGIGVLAPKFALRLWARRLSRLATDELPLLIDLLRLLQSVGFSIDQSLQMIADRFRPALPVLGKELQEANLAYSRGRSRPQSLRRLAECFDDDDLHSLVQMIVQVHQHGGAVQEPLKQFGERLREQRKMKMKEKVGRLSVKMTLVMMVTLLPALMLVLAGPAVVALVGTIGKLGGHR